jgi:hypothetical protein
VGAPSPASLVKAKGLPSCMRMDPIPFSNASHSNTNVFVKSRSVKARFNHIASFKAWKELSANEVQVKAFFLRREVKGVAIFP